MPLSALAAGLAQAPDAEVLAAYQQVRIAPLDPAAAAVTENFQFEAGTGKFLFKNGTLQFLQPVNGVVTGAVFVGDGTFTLDPPTAIEKRQLSRFIDGAAKMEEPFREAVFLFTDAAPFAELKKGAAPQSRAAGVLEDFRKTFRDDLRTNLAARITADLADPRHASLMVLIRGEKSGKLIFSVDPLSREEVELVNFNNSLEYFDTWCAFRPGGAAMEDKSLGDTLKVRLDTTLEGKKLSGEARTEIKALRTGPRVIPFHLLATLRVTKVALEGGPELKFIQEDKKKDAGLWVILPAPMEAGKTLVLNFSYAGEDVVQSEGEGNFYVGARTSWYPRIQNSGDALGDRADYEMTFRAPKQYQVLATGRLLKEREEGKLKITEWASDTALPIAGFNYGRFKGKTQLDSGIEFGVYTNPGLNNELGGLKTILEANPEAAREAGITTGGLNTTGMAERALAEAVQSVRLFTYYFGALPFTSIAVSQQTASNFGQSWPGLIFMPYTALLDQTTKNQLGMLDRSGSRRFFEEVGSHEIAHQWWGHVVGWNDYHDQWLSEGFADFSASLFLQASQGDDKLRSFWASRREQIKAPLPTKTIPANEAGPIWLGQRLETRKTPNGYMLVYSKGGYVLNMLRMMMYEIREHDDRAFIALMQDFVKTYAGKTASTEDFKKICDKHFRQDMSWFFNQWVYGTAIPKVKVQYSLKPDGAGSILSGDVKLEGVPPDFQIWMPLVIRAGKGMMSGKLRVIGAAPFEFKLPVMPDNVEFNALNAVLCDLDVKKL